jgi:hypothetical protein
MEQEVTLIRQHLKAPRAGAIAGIVFSTLLIISLVLIRITVPANPQETGSWLSKGLKNVRLAFNLLPFAGIAFLWLIGVLRDRIGAYEDRFFATVFLGSGLLFLAMLFACSVDAPPEPRLFCLDFSGFPAVGAPDQRTYTLGESKTQANIRSLNR